MLAKIIVLVAALIFSEICIHIIICGRKNDDIFKNRKTKQIQGIYYRGLLTQTYLKSKARRPKGGLHLNFQAQFPFAGVCLEKLFEKKIRKRQKGRFAH